MSEITQCLDDYREGRIESLDQVFERLYPELRQIAAAKLRALPAGTTLTPTVVVHDAYLRLVGNERLKPASRRHFFACAAKAMRCLLVDHARRVGAAKRGGELHRVTWSESVEDDAFDPSRLLDLDRVLDELDDISSRSRELVDLRFFAGFSVKETAEMLDLSVRTAEREWERARAFLVARLNPPEGTSHGRF